MIAATLIAAGVVAGTVPLRSQPQGPVRAGEFFVLAADLHVHSFFGDGSLPPWEIIREARRRGLDVVAITNHNQMIGARMAAKSAGNPGHPLVLAGQEVTAPRFHLIGVGISSSVDWRLSASQAAAAVQAQGGVAIAAHPDRATWGAAGDAARRAVDGAEIGDPHPATDDPWTGWEVKRFFEESARVNRSLAPIGASDFHFVQPLGICRTHVLAAEVSERGVLEAIREARTVSQDGNGVLYGDPALIALIEGKVPRNTAGTPLWRTLGAVAVLAGFALIVLVR